jgi:hypothetical protein
MCRGIHARPQVRNALVHPTLPFEFDTAAQLFVDEHPHGATLDEVGEALGLNRERVRQIEHAALAKIRKLSPAFLKENAA